MATVEIAGEDYPSYIELDDADLYLAADALRADAWALLDDERKGQGLVSATRLLQRQSWVAGEPPATDDALPAVQAATALLAADITAKPALGDSAATASNVKAVGAGSARVEFFRPTEGYVLPAAAFALLRGLLGVPPGDLSSVGLDNAAYGSSPGQRSRFDPTDYRRTGGTWVDPSEVFY